MNFPAQPELKETEPNTAPRVIRLVNLVLPGKGFAPLSRSCNLKRTNSMQKYLAHHLIHIPEHRKKVRALAAADTTLKSKADPHRNRKR